MIIIDKYKRIKMFSMLIFYCNQIRTPMQYYNRHKPIKDSWNVIFIVLTRQGKSWAPGLRTCLCRPIANGGESGIHCFLNLFSNFSSSRLFSDFQCSNIHRDGVYVENDLFALYLQHWLGLTVLGRRTDRNHAANCLHCLFRQSISP